MKYFIIGDEDAVLGFGMVGVQGQAAATPDDAKEAFDRAISDKDVGIIIITERIAGLIRSAIDRFLFKEAFPLIVEIPDRSGAVSGRIGIREIVTASIGLKI
ncbi:MAG TPA: Vacuolar H+transporting two-sector ATPase F subunit [Spirochaetes bacterium]|nr:Vacuolar H+transporting two-sector ATPase F subunit [Spirochaetota bacterium]